VPASPALTDRIQQAANKARDEGDFARAQSLLTSHLSRYGPDPHTQALLAMVYVAQRNINQAIALFEQAWKRAPGDPAIAALYGGVLVSTGEVERGKTLLELVPADHPAIAGAKFNLAAAESRLENYEVSERHLRDLLEHPPALMNVSRPHLVTTLASMLPKLMRLEETRTMLRKLLREFPGEPLAMSILAAVSVYSDEVTPRQLFDFHVTLGRKLADMHGGQGISQLPAWWTKNRQESLSHAAHGKLTIGLLSADLRDHVVSRFIMAILERGREHNINFICYYLHSKSDTMTARCRRAVDPAFASRFPTDDLLPRGVWQDSPNWRALHDLKDQQVSAMMLADRCDVIIDLQGHTLETRVGLLSRRLAPLQGSAIGYASSSGVPGIDIRIVDSITDPAPTADQFATERLVRLDPCFLCYDPSAAEKLPDVSENADPHAPFTFACFNNLAKWTPTTMRLWKGVLDAAPQSRLVIKSQGIKPGQRTELVRARLREHGLDLERVEILEHAPANLDHFLAYNRVDATLDTFPYHGTTTTCEALSMGVPVVTLIGDRHAARVGASLLSAVGGQCTEHIAADPQHYITIAAGLAAQGKRTELQRTALRNEMLRSILCDGGAYAAAWNRTIRAALADRFVAPANAGGVAV
jgi:protein O-GlcNAc transferase